MLFKTSEELEIYIALSANFTFSKIAPFIKYVERDFLAKDFCLGPSLYNTLNAQYNANNLSNNNQNLLPYAQEVVACFAFVKWIPTGQLDISDVGIRIDNSDTQKTAYQYQVRDLKADWIDNGYAAQEALLAFLKTNATTYSQWSGSSAYSVYKEFLFTGAEDFQRYVNINNSRRTYAVLAPTMRMVESLYVMQTIGSDYLAELKTKIFSNTLNANDNKIIGDLKNAVAQLTIHHATKTLPVVVSGDGIVINSFVAARENAEQMQPAALEYIDRLKNETEINGRTLLEKVRDYLNTMASDTVFATYFSSGLYDDPDIPGGPPIWVNGSDFGQVVL